MAKQTKTTTQLDEKTLKDPDLLSKGEIEQLLPLLDELIDWAKRFRTTHSNRHWLARRTADTRSSRASRGARLRTKMARSKP